MNKFESTKKIAPSFLNWVTSECLPFWGSAGVDWNRGGFYERLNFAGQPVSDVSKRLMVQGRQLYVYCRAGLSGWYGSSRPLAEQCVGKRRTSGLGVLGISGWKCDERRTRYVRACFRP